MHTKWARRRRRSIVSLGRLGALRLGITLWLAANKAGSLVSIPGSRDGRDKDEEKSDESSEMHEYYL
jgi:hypothetical protein